MHVYMRHKSETKRIWQDHYFESLPECQYHVRAMVAITRMAAIVFFACKNKRMHVECVSTPLRGHARIHPVGLSGADRSLDAAPRREDKRAKEGPRLTAPGNDSLQMLCRVTSANHNNSFKPPRKCDTKNRATAFFSAPIMRPRDKHLHGEEEKKRRGSLKFSFVLC